MKRFVWLLLLPAAASAQVPPAPVAGTATTAAAPAARTGLFARLFSKTPEARQLCRVRFANSPAGQLVNGLLKPLGGLTGGLVKPIGANEPNPESAKKPAESAQGAKARIQAEEAQAEAKVADIEFLAKKDCRRFPEAEAALIASLRADTQECVRLAAAKALLAGCCCTPKVVKALTICVSGSKADGNLPEDSERVRLVAFAALEKCLRSYRPVEEPPEKPGKDEPDEVAQASYVARETADVFAQARTVLARGLYVSPETTQRMARGANLRDVMAGVTNGAPAPPPLPVAPAPLPPQVGPVAPPPMAMPTRDRSLMGIWKSATGR